MILKAPVNVIKPRFFWPILALLAFLVPTVAMYHLPLASLIMVENGWQVGCYEGPLWRDGDLMQSAIGSSVVLLLLYPATGTVGLLSAGVVKVLKQRLHAIWWFPVWSLITIAILLVTGLLAIGPSTPGTVVSDKTIWGATLSSIVPVKALAFGLNKR